MAFPDKGLPVWPGGGGQHANDSGLPKDRLNLTFLDEIERVAEIGFNGREGDGIASAAGTTDITGANGTLVTITGSLGPITGFGTAPYAGWKRWVIFTEAPTITDSATLKIYPSGRRDIIAAAGDVALIVSRGGTSWEIHVYQRADGFPLTGLIQTVGTSTGAVASTTNVFGYDDTLPINTDGGEFLTLAITPKYPDSTLEVFGSLLVRPSAITKATAMGLFRDAVVNAKAATTQFGDAVTSGQFPIHILFRETSGSVAATTYKLRAGLDSAGTLYLNADSGGTRRFGGVANSYITIREIR